MGSLNFSKKINYLSWNLLQVTWNDIIGEPEGIRSPECAWRLSGHCFRLSRGFWYILLSVLIAPLVALCLGITFACLTFTVRHCLKFHQVYNFLKINIRPSLSFFFFIDIFFIQQLTLMENYLIVRNYSGTKNKIQLDFILSFF